jgi:hypothetical protein
MHAVARNCMQPQAKILFDRTQILRFGRRRLKKRAEIETLKTQEFQWSPIV